MNTRSATRLMIYSDAPTSRSGLGRITRELASHIYSDSELHDKFTIATLGMGGPHSCNLSYANYPVTNLAGPLIPEFFMPTWRDFAGSQRGIILAIVNPSWLGWIANPRLTLPDSPLRSFLTKPARPFDLWAYTPIDGSSPTGQLSDRDAENLSLCDRVLATTQYGSSIIDQSTKKLLWQNTSTPHLPHGLDTGIFNPRPRAGARAGFMSIVTEGQIVKPAQPSTVLIGCVATNSSRKDWPLAIHTTRLLKDRGLSIFLWAHTDSPDKHWDIPQLARDYGISGQLILTHGNLSDDAMAQAYSACDLTLAIGSGEGWGWPIAESLACGTPVIHGNYAAGAEILNSYPQMLIDPVAWRVEYNSGILRPIHSADEWASRAIDLLANPQPISLPAHLSWDACWTAWKSWLLDV